MRLALKFAYDGKKYHGYARQPNLNTIEGEIISSLIKNNCISDPKKSCFRAASRTDKKVSAMSNIVAFNTNKNIDKILQDLNKNSENIVFYGYKQVSSDFYPRYAKQRIYRYHLKKEKNNDIKKIKKAANFFIGTFDFSNFARIESFKIPVRTIDDIAVYEDKKFIYIDFFAQTFLWHQIRRIMAAIISLYNDKIGIDTIKNALENPNNPVDLGISSAEPLILMDVIYDFDFICYDYFLKEKEILEKKILENIY